MKFLKFLLSILFFVFFMYEHKENYSSISDEEDNYLKKNDIIMKKESNLCFYTKCILGYITLILLVCVIIFIFYIEIKGYSNKN